MPTVRRMPQPWRCDSLTAASAIHLIMRLPCLIALTLSLCLGCWVNDALAQGAAIPIGGALADDNAPVWNRIVAAAGGPGARFAVFGTASGTPDASAAHAVDVLDRYGAQARGIGLKAPAGEAAATPEEMANWIEWIDQANGVFFTGGAQERITAALQPGGIRTPLLDALWRLYRRGGTIAGTSAGAAVLSNVMFRDAQDVLAVMRDGVRMGHEVDRGLGFAGDGLFVDQHFLRRGRLARMIVAMQTHRIPIGIGVDEDCAAVIQGGQIEVVGSSGAVVVDLTDAQVARSTTFGVQGARLHYLEAGDRFDLASRILVPSASKLAGTLLDPATTIYHPYHASGAFYPDMLGDRVVVAAMTRLIDSPAAEVRGLAFDPAGDASSTAPGFEFRLYKTDGIRGWLSTQGGPERYTVSGVGLDIRPVRFARPLYTPW